MGLLAVLASGGKLNHMSFLLWIHSVWAGSGCKKPQDDKVTVNKLLFYLICKGHIYYYWWYKIINMGDCYMEYCTYSIELCIREQMIEVKETAGIRKGHVS